MADERGSELGSGGEVQSFSSSHGTVPVIVSSGSRPLQISSTPVDGNAQKSLPSAPVASFSSPVAATIAPSVQVNVATSSGGIVIRTGGSAAPIQPRVLLTSSATVISTSSVQQTTSGIVIRSSTSSATSATSGEVATDRCDKASDVTVDHSRQATIVEETRLISAAAAAVPGVTAAASVSKSTESPSCPAAQFSTTLPDREALDVPSMLLPQCEHSNELHPSSAILPSSSSSSPTPDGFIRPSASSRSRPTSVAVEPPMTWSEITNRLDLVTVCGFVLAVLAIAFGSILAGDDLPFGWLLGGVSAISILLFAKYHL